MQDATHAPRHGITKLVTIAVPLGIASALTIIVFFYAGTRERDQRQLVFARQAQTWAHTIDKSIHRSIEALYAIERLYVSSKSVERHEFQTFVAGSLTRLPGMQALEWIPRVPAAQRAAYEATAQRQGFPTFQLTNSSSRRLAKTC